jgi:hypothetical protein
MEFFIAAPGEEVLSYSYKKLDVDGIDNSFAKHKGLSSDTNQSPSSKQRKSMSYLQKLLARFPNIDLLVLRR